MHAPKKQTWQERCVEIHAFHVYNIKLLRGWSVRDTAKALNRSIGAISEDLQLAEFLRAHSEIANFRRQTDALEWMRKKKLELRERL